MRMVRALHWGSMCSPTWQCTAQCVTTGTGRAGPRMETVLHLLPSSSPPVLLGHCLACQGPESNRQYGANASLEVQGNHLGGDSKSTAPRLCRQDMPWAPACLPSSPLLEKTNSTPWAPWAGQVCLGCSHGEAPWLGSGPPILLKCQGPQQLSHDKHVSGSQQL